MNFYCPAPPPGAGALRALVFSADCNARHYAEAGYLALTGTQSFFPAALTSLLVIVVALFGYRLLLGFGGTRFGDVPVLAVKIGIVLALTLQWPLFQTLVFDLAYDAPVQVASATFNSGTARGNAVNPLDDAQNAYDVMQRVSTALARSGNTTNVADAGIRVRASTDLARSARTLLMTTAGTLSAALVAIAILTAIGPIFIALLLLAATAGLFLGWVRALVAAALAPMVIWSTAALMNEMLRPQLGALAAQSDGTTLDLSLVDQVVTTVEVFSIAQIGLILLGLVVALALRLPRRGGRNATATSRQTFATAAPVTLSRSEQLADTLRTPSMLRTVAAGAAAPGGTRSVTNLETRERLQGGTSVQSSGERVGDTYRRGRFTDRATLRGTGR